MDDLLGDEASALVTSRSLPEPGGLSAAELVAALARIERERNRLAAYESLLVAEVEARRIAGDYARSTTAELLVVAQRITPFEARARLERAQLVTPRRSLLGELLPPLLPGLAVACAAGDVSPAQAAVIIDCVERLPEGHGPDTMSVVERVLVEAAAHEHPVALRRTATLLLARLDQDGTAPRERDIERRRGLHLHHHGDGSARLTGTLTPETAATWAAVLDTLSAPAPVVDGLPDHRSAPQRRHDALADAGQRLLRSGTLPAAGGVPVTVLARLTLADLHAGGGLALTGHGTPLPVDDLLAAAGDAELVPVVLDAHGAVTSVGRTRRLATRSQRLALATRDGGCTFPDCDRPATWCEVHHVVPWQHGGGTDLDNMTLLCRFHHREFERRGWTVRMTDGRPDWIPPAWLDPHQRPRRNRTHHPPDFRFTDPVAA